MPTLEEETCVLELYSSFIPYLKYMVEWLYDIGTNILIPVNENELLCIGICKLLLFGKLQNLIGLHTIRNVNKCDL
jgi:hypothetical protein